LGWSFAIIVAALNLRAVSGTVGSPYFSFGMAPSISTRQTPLLSPSPPGGSIYWSDTESIGLKCRSSWLASRLVLHVLLEFSELVWAEDEARGLNLPKLVFLALAEPWLPDA
jgi:hypothetical protein